MSTSVVTQGVPAIKNARDLAFYLQDWLTTIVPNQSERAEALRCIADVLWTGTTTVRDALEEYAAEIDPGANELEPVAYDLCDVDGYERTTDGIFTPTEFDAWLTVERTRG